MFKVKVGDAEKSIDVLSHLRGALEKPHAMLADMGEHLVNSTQERFRTSTAPDGSKWQANSQTTYINILSKKHETQLGKLNSNGINRVMSKRPLIGEGGFAGGLAGSFHYQVSGNLLLVGTPMIYAAVQHYGAKKGEFGKNTPWGDIPARPFLGLSAADQDELAAIAEDHFLGS